MEALQDFMNMKFDRPNYFKRDVYPTPNVSCRAVIFNEKKQILLVQEKCDGGYSIPGGWCDLYDTPIEAVTREAKEEAGVKVKVKRIAAILSKKPLSEADTFVPEYALFFECEIVENLHTHDHEILNVEFFDLDNLPKFSWKIKQSEFDRAVDAILNNKTIVD
jgi:8-oxo-dGTP pyrophosphatase MutT (NUDIX family)